MNATSGGHHILLFERDQQLTSILSTELTRAGYEVHMARTAVEVFDTIARFPVKLVMVDLAQAQAGRREFWVALDAQRRGRGVQVFTFRCANLGGYGPEDPDERIDTVATDLEVEGMYGLVKLVDAVRGRVPGANAAPPPRPAPSSLDPYNSPTRPAPDPYQDQMALRSRDMQIPSASMTNAQPLQGTVRPSSYPGQGISSAMPPESYKDQES